MPAAIDVSLAQFTDTSKLHVWTGPMFAGKTTALLAEVERLRGRGLKVHLVQARKDTRYGS